MATYTGFINFDGSVEEIDVQAETEREARVKIEAEVEADYAEGGVIIRIERRINGTYFF